MKKALKLTLILSCVLAFTLALSLVSFASSTESSEYGTLDTVEDITEPSTIDKNARAVVAVDGTYYTVPAYYLIKDSETFTWSVPTAVREKLGVTLSADKEIRRYVVRMEIPEGITTMTNWSFHISGSEENKVLVTVKFPTTLEEIGVGTFNQCSALTHVDNLEKTKITALSGNPNATYNDNSGTFSKCYALTALSLPSTVTRIEQWAATTCTSLATVTVPHDAQITHIGQYAFEKSLITTFYFPSTLTYIGRGAFEKTKLTTLENFKNTQLTEVVEYAFNSTAITSLELPQTLTAIGQYAFGGHLIVQDKLVIPNGVTTIGKCAFAGNYKTINTIVLPANLEMTTESGVYPFEKVYFNEMYIPQGVTAFPQGTFNGAKTSGVAFFFAGTQAQAESLKSSSNTSSNGAFVVDTTTVLSISDYLALSDSDKSSKKNFLVYDVNHCNAFYEGTHAFGELTPVFTNGQFVSACSLTGVCTRTQCAKEEVDSTIDALFSFAGFSKSDYNGAIMQSLAIDKTLLPQYKEFFGEISFGLLAAVEDTDPSDEVAGQFGGALYDTETGAFKNKVASVDFSERAYDVFEMKIVGLEAYANATVYCCGYVIANGKLLYLHNGTASENPTAVTYASLTV
ncbi:MAG: leucine-rich repeat protein [Clostridia bacterium]|nr:leucine-rich repeat protein [Clostridia bacterium]